MAFPHCSVTVKCHNKAKIVCPQGKLEKGTIFHAHTKGNIYYKSFHFSFKCCLGHGYFAMEKNVQSVRFKENVMYKSNIIYVNINHM